MAATPKDYHRLPGRGLRKQGFLSFSVAGSRARLWLGKDHLLMVESQFYREDYRRFYFRDIQAFVLRRTNQGRFISITLAVLVLLFGSISVGSAGGVEPYFFWIVTAGFALFLLWNTLLGPTCECHLRTAVQMEELPSLRRLRRARRVLDRLRPLIIAAQGQLPEGVTPSYNNPLPQGSPPPAEAGVTAGGDAPAGGLAPAVASATPGPSADRVPPPG